MKVAVVILAAGRSKRMGTPKQLLPFRNATLLGNTIETVQKVGTENIYCVLGAYYAIIKDAIKKYPCTVLYNADFEEGLSSSIKCAVNALLDVDNIFFVLGDQPNITSDYLKTMIYLSEKKTDKIVVSNYGKRLGVPAIIPKKYFSELVQLSGDKGARDIFNSGKYPVEIVRSSVNLFDIDTYEDYKKLLQE